MGVFNCQRNKIRSEVKVEVYKMGVVETRFAELIWSHEPINSGGLVKLAQEELGWKKSTTYTVIKKCINKGAIERKEPNFTCRPLISKEEAQKYETRELIEKMYDGCPDQLIAALIGEKSLDQAGILRLKELVKDL